MSEPDRIVQSVEPMNLQQSEQWFREQAKAGLDAGMKHARYSVHERNRDWRLYEGWREKPVTEGAPRWKSPEQLTPQPKPPEPATPPPSAMPPAAGPVIEQQPAAQPPQPAAANPTEAAAPPNNQV